MNSVSTKYYRFQQVNEQINNLGISQVNVRVYVNVLNRCKQCVLMTYRRNINSVSFRIFFIIS